MNFFAKCFASIPKTAEVRWVLIRIDNKGGQLHGELAEAIGTLERDKTYRITIEEVDG
jgi:hypothetical protein